MTPEEYRNQLLKYDWENQLKIGDIVEARFTNCYDNHSFKAKITKINRQTVRVVSLEKDKPYKGEELGREFIIHRRTNPLFSVNNGIFKTE